MARRARYLAPDPMGEIYKQLVIQRMQAKVEADRQKKIQAMLNAPPPGPGVPDPDQMPEGSWSALPGARNTNVPFVMGEGGQHGYDELYRGSPYADQGRNWSSPEQWARYNDSSRIPDWLRTPESGLGPAFEPSPELQTLREQVRTLRGMAPTRADIMGRADFHDQLARAVAMAEEDTASSAAYDEARGVKPVAPGIANIWGPYDDSQDRYADIEPGNGVPARNIASSYFPEEPMPPGPAGEDYKWGMPRGGFLDAMREEEATTDFTSTYPYPSQDITEIYSGGPRMIPNPVVDPITKQPKKGQEYVPSTTPGPQWGYPNPDQPPPLPEPVLKKKQKPPPPVRLTGKPVSFSSRGDEPIPGWALEQYGIKKPEAKWANEPTAPGPPRPQMPEPGTLWDNYEPEFVAAMHSGDENEINKVKDSIRLFGW